MAEYGWVASPVKAGLRPPTIRDERANPLAGLDQITRNRYLGGRGPLIVFCPVLVRDALQGDIGEFSIALGAFGFGGLLGAVVLRGRSVSVYMLAMRGGLSPGAERCSHRRRPVQERQADRARPKIRNWFWPVLVRRIKGG